MIRMSTSIIIIRLMICTVIFVPSCYTDTSSGWEHRIRDYQFVEAAEAASEIVERRHRLEDMILSNVSRLTIGSPAHGQLINSMPSENGHSGSRIAEVMIEATKNLMMRICGFEVGVNVMKCAKDISKLELNGTQFSDMWMTEYYNNNSCNGKEFDYRSPDGLCNNRKRNYLGKANTSYKRLLFPVYEDGLSSVPAFLEKKLPEPRLVSTTLVKDGNSSDHTKTMMMAYWTMFIGHDLSHTAVSTMGTDHRFISCCHKNKDIQYAINKDIKSCMPIYVPIEDSLCQDEHQNCMMCMNYVRSRPAIHTDYKFGPMEQMNQATHYLDASMIYGTTEQKTLSLREMSLGQLLVHRRYYFKPSADILKTDTTDTNVCQNGTGTCFKVGDIRANAYPQLTALYTMWVREHNRVARELNKEKLFWTDEELFQEAKKIVTACIQHITYNEWLPALLGVNYTKENGLGLEQRTTYNESADPSVSNSFATAILPFANSMISDEISLNISTASLPRTQGTFGTPWHGPGTLKRTYNRPVSVFDSFSYMLQGLTVQATQKVDMLFTESITNYLYVLDPSYYPFGMDIVSLDIQRSRDHGIPGYTQFRKYCGLKGIETVKDLSEIMVDGSADKLLKLYKTWDDIDLLVGALLEKHVDDAMVGPTMRCIIREQFVRTRTADRYFYDVPGVFTDYQLENIKRVTLSRVLCDSGDIEMMPVKVFSRWDPYHSYIHHCNSTSIPGINFSGWFDRTQDDFFEINNMMLNISHDDNITLI